MANAIGIAKQKMAISEKLVEARVKLEVIRAQFAGGEASIETLESAENAVIVLERTLTRLAAEEAGEMVDEFIQKRDEEGRRRPNPLRVQ